MKSMITTALTVLLASAALVGIVVAATTIGANIYSTGGGLFDKASTTAFQVQNGSGTRVLEVDTTNTGLKVTGAATSTIYLWVGAAGTNNNAGYTGGALYVQGNAEIDGTLFLARATSTSATTTDYLYVGPDFTEPAGFNFAGGDLAVSNDVAIGGNATTTGNMTIDGTTLVVQADTNRVSIGSATPTSTLQVSGGNVHFQPASGAEGVFFDATNNRLGVGRKDPAYLVDVLQRQTGTGWQPMTRVDYYALPSTPGGSNYFAFDAEITLQGSGNYTNNDQGNAAQFNAAYHSGSGTVTRLSGGTFYAYNLGSGTVTDLSGINTYLESASSGTITNAKGVWIRDLYLYSGTVTNSYGLYIENINDATNNFAIYSEGGKSYHAGNFGIGDTSPAYLLTVGNGELFVADSSGNASTTGKFVSGGALTVGTTTATTTGQAFIGAPAGTATSTVVIGHAEKPDGCIEMWENGVAYRIFVNGGTLVTQAGRCKD